MIVVGIGMRQYIWRDIIRILRIVNDLFRSWKKKRGGELSFYGVFYDAYLKFLMCPSLKS